MDEIKIPLKPPYNHTNPHGDWEVLGKFTRLDVCEHPRNHSSKIFIAIIYAKKDILNFLANL